MVVAPPTIREGKLCPNGWLHAIGATNVGDTAAFKPVAVAAAAWPKLAMRQCTTFVRTEAFQPEILGVMRAKTTCNTKYWRTVW